MTRVDLVWFKAGGGHRAAAQALQQVMGDTSGERTSPWQPRLLHLTEVLDPQGLFQRLTGLEPEDLYNKRLASGFTLGLAQELKLLQALIRMGHGSLVQRLARHWAAAPPDLVVSLIPNFNRAMHDALALACPGVPFVTVLTDMADHPPAFWMEPGTQQHLVCGTEHAVQQALAAGFASQRVHRASGMILRPGFYAPPALPREQARAALGLDAHTPTGLVMFGGAGSRVMRQISQDLPHTPLILLCGNNTKLADELRALPSQAPRFVVGHTPDVAGWMRCADFFIGKPGPGSLSEAVQMGLPVLVTRNAWTMPQERWNTDWVQAHGVGVVQRSFRDVAVGVAELCATLPAYQARVRALNNRAVFEVPQILARILREAAPQPTAPLASPA
jgi:hypothetical protein